MPLSQLYQEHILEHNRSPCNHMHLPDATHKARGLDALCGDDLYIWLIVSEDRIKQASWTGEACAITTASASMLTEWLAGKTHKELREGFEGFSAMLANPEFEADAALMTFDSLRPVSGFPSRVRNALLPWRTALQALGDPAD